MQLPRLAQTTFALHRSNPPQPSYFSFTVSENQQNSPPTWTTDQYPKVRTVWYGGQTLVGVLGSDVIAIIGAGTGVNALAIIGIGGHVITGPIVHWAHGHVGKGFISLGLNVGLPLVGVGAGALFEDDGTDIVSTRTLAMILLGGVGGIVAPILDISIFSTEEVPNDHAILKERHRILPSSISLMPMLDQNRRGLMLGGRF